MEYTAVAVMFFLIFGGGSVVTKLWADYNRTRIEIARLKGEPRPTLSQGNNRDIETLRAELEATRKELQELRDTSMQYDISFDTALGRMESRVAHVERRVGLNASEVEAERITLTGR